MKRSATASLTLLVFGLAACNADGVLQPTARPLPPPSFDHAFPFLSACAAPPSGIVSWWRGDGSGNDAVGGNNATLANGTTFASGMVGNAFLMDGADDDVNAGTHANLNVGGGAGMTMQAWIHPEGVSVVGSNSSGPILEYVNGAHFWQYGSATALYTNWVDTNGGYHTISVATGVTQNAWNHVASTYVKSTGVATLYINGVAVVSQVIGSFSIATTTEFHIGNRPINSFGSPGAFKGRIDDAQIYNRALTGAEIQATYNQGIAGSCQLVANAGAPVTGSEGTPVAFNGTASTGQASRTYDWDFGDGSAHGTTAAPSHTYKDNGSYTATLTLTDGLLTSSATTAATISNVAPVPTLTLQTVPPVHTGQPFVLRAGFSDKGVLDGPWGYKFFRNTTLLQQGTKPNQPPTGVTQAVNLTAGAVGTYTFKLEMTDKDGTTGTATLVVQVIP